MLLVDLGLFVGALMQIETKRILAQLVETEMNTNNVFFPQMVGS